MRCINAAGDARVHGLRFVDVQRRCLVDGDDGAKYVALSYLWGKSPTPEGTLSASTISSLYKPFSLTEKILPTTVEDAITVTTKLGEKFLWIDRLCVMQDSDLDKAKFVPQMHLIYGNAQLTIIAAAGKDCDAGLPGVRPGSRVKQQKVHSFGSISVMESLDPKSENEGQGLLASTTYSKRGWCYQERCVTS